MTGDGRAVLEVGGQSFRLSAEPLGGLVFKIAAAEQAGDVAKAMSLTLRVLRSVIDAEDVDAFDAFYESEAFDSLGFDEITSALQRAVEGAAGGRPTGRSASSPPGSRAAGAKSRVVSLSPGTRQASSSDGRSAAS